ncbi:MAG: cupin domain-containing protein, partial [Alphaproteobacteria bacterium]|nr:cupin domain-containing protein [Alphaproteobacteria bacterium]
NLIDTAKGETIPDDIRPMRKTTSEQIAQLAVLNNEALRACCVMADEEIGAYEKDNIHYRPLIGANAKLNWPHDFTVSQIIIPPKQTHAQAFNISGGNGAEVIFIYQGELSIKTDSQHIIMKAGDTASVPMNSARQYANESSENVRFLCVQRND